MKSLRLILAVARYELKMQVRAFALWVVALLLTILVWITLSTPQILQRARQNVAYSVVSNVGLAAGALLIFIIAPSLYTGTISFALLTSFGAGQCKLANIF